METKIIDVNEEIWTSKAESGLRTFKMTSIILGFLISGFADCKFAFTSLFNYKQSTMIIGACLKWTDCLGRMFLRPQTKFLHKDSQVESVHQGTSL